jgi:flagellar protein FlaJ
MVSYGRLAFRMFGEYVENLMPYFTDLKLDIRRARMKISVQEFISTCMLTAMIAFIVALPVLSFVLGLFIESFLFSFIMAFTLSIVAGVGAFFAYMRYPQSIITSNGKQVDNYLPFALLYLSTVASTKLSVDKTLKLFAKFSDYGQITNEISSIVNDVDAFGVDINTAIERAVDRATSKNLREMLWGMLSTMRSGGDISLYLKEKSKNAMAEYRRKLYEFSQQLTVYIEVYLTSIVLGTVFFTILTAIMSGIGGSGASDVIVLQFFLIFLFLPLISAVFIILVKTISPSSD